MTPKPFDFLLLVLLGVIFGFSFVFIKMSATNLSSLVLVCIRVGFAVVVLNILLRMFKLKLDLNKKWKDYTLQSAVGFSIPFYLIAQGSKKLDSSFLSIMMGSLPIITIVIAHFFTEDEKITLRSFIGLLIGFLGIIILIFPGNTFHNNNSLVSCCLAFLGCVFFAISTITGRRFKNDPPLITTTGSLTCAFLYLIPLSLVSYVFEKPIITINSLYAIALLGTLCTGIAYFIFFSLLSRIGATWTSVHDYLVPIFGTIFGILFFGEKINCFEILGGIIILTGIFISYYKPTQSSKI